MKSHMILRKLQNLRKVYRDQNFVFTSEQQAEYDALVVLRRERVDFMYANDMVA